MAEREGGEEADRRALDKALRRFAKDILSKPGREPDFEDWIDTDGIYGYQVLFWEERPGEDWSKWIERRRSDEGSRGSWQPSYEKSE